MSQLSWSRADDDVRLIVSLFRLFKGYYNSFVKYSHIVYTVARIIILLTFRAVTTDSFSDL